MNISKLTNMLVLPMHFVLFLFSLSLGSLVSPKVSPLFHIWDFFPPLLSLACSLTSFVDCVNCLKHHTNNSKLN